MGLGYGKQSRNSTSRASRRSAGALREPERRESRDPRESLCENLPQTGAHGEQPCLLRNTRRPRRAAPSRAPRSAEAETGRPRPRREGPGQRCRLSRGTPWFMTCVCVRVCVCVCALVRVRACGCACVVLACGEGGEWRGLQTPRIAVGAAAAAAAAAAAVCCSGGSAGSFRLRWRPPPTARRCGPDRAYGWPGRRIDIGCIFVMRGLKT